MLIGVLILLLLALCVGTVLYLHLDNRYTKESTSKSGQINKLVDSNEKLTQGIQDITKIGQQAIAASPNISPAQKAALNQQLNQVNADVAPAKVSTTTTTTQKPRSTTTTTTSKSTTTTTTQPRSGTTTTTIPPGCTYQETPTGQKVLVCPP